MKKIFSKSITLILTLLILSLSLSQFSYSASHSEIANTEKYEKIQVNPEGTKLHPPVTHFGIAVPFILLILQILYLVLRKELDIVEFVVMLIALGGVTLSTLTGIYISSIMQQPEIGESPNIYNSHMIIGIIMLILYLIIASLRIAYEFIKNQKPRNIIRWIYFSLILISVLILLYQGWLGGRLVYEFGTGIIYQYITN